MSLRINPPIHIHNKIGCSRNPHFVILLPNRFLASPKFGDVIGYKNVLRGLGLATARLSKALTNPNRGGGTC